ncbi:MAG: hypothetical protein OXH56_03415 [Gemmatimonadetes bacterium]|nr:hypothetical protein [Gemmatimonadota bacterium]
MWKTINNIAYRLYFAYRNRMSRRENRRWVVRTALTPGPEPRPVLYVAWGRIGDVVLTTGHLKRMRRWFHPSPIWFLGRSRVRPLVELHVDAFLPFPEPAARRTGADGRDTGRTGADGRNTGRTGADGAPAAMLEGIANRSFRCVIADIHTFYGGLFALDSVLSTVRADRKFVYEGYRLGEDLAPERPYPAGYEIVPKYEERKGVGKDDAPCHLLHHNAHYLRSVLEHCGVETVGGEAWRPELDHVGSGTDACRQYGVEPGEYVAWQPFSDNRRKDYPLARWAEAIRAFPEMQFVALVEPGRADEVSRTAPPGVRVVATSLTGVMKLIREARLYVGLDSGLSHISTVMGTPTVCVCPDSHLGYFFPYPESYGFKNLQTVSHPDYLSCRGCFMTCRHEPLTSTVTRGALCLRTLPSQLVIEAIRSAL